MSFNPSKINLYTTTELNDYAAQGHRIPGDVFIRAQEREGISKAQATEDKRLAKLTADAHAAVVAERDNHRDALADALAEVESLRDEAARKLHAYDVAHRDFNAAVNAQATAYRHVRDIVSEHFTDPTGPVGSDPEHFIPDSFGADVYVNGEPYPQVPVNSLRERPAYREAAGQ